MFHVLSFSCKVDEKVGQFFVDSSCTVEEVEKMCMQLLSHVAEIKVQAQAQVKVEEDADKEEEKKEEPKEG